ncbi:hypothetical protein AMR72_16595 [Flavobacterium psychrophilum]|nr:hypothetical protein AMR72_16595 [Flavobacterium psychrophilum]AOE53977.1 hypothetical protein ALW18_16585 [Flavobacterium psychrophilum]
MKKILFILILIQISCKPSDLGRNNCNENLKFKEAFFHHIRYIDNNITVLQDSTFIKSVIFISNYAPVSTDELMNYSRTYPTGIFQQDRKKWVEWYDENKCKNIQFKETYVIPEAYMNHN